MNLSVAQESEYAGSEGKDWWKWAVWIDGPDEALDALNFVEYFLHPTFPNPVHSIRNRQTRFRLNASGWGGFTINVTLHFKDGSTKKLSHFLELRFPTNMGPHLEAKEKSLSVVLSVSLDQQEAGARAERFLGRKGINVHKTANFNQDVPWEVQLMHLLEEADAFVAIVGPEGGKWVEREMLYAIKNATPVIPIAIGQQNRQPVLSKLAVSKSALPKGVEFLRIDSQNDLEDGLLKLGAKMGVFTDDTRPPFAPHR